MMTATTKLKINLEFPGKLYCNDCQEYFTPEDYEGPIWWNELIAGNL